MADSKIPAFDCTFPQHWAARILPARPLILPSSHYTYPAIAEEVEKGALEVWVEPSGQASFLATCALGFRDPAVPTGLWSMPHPNWLCAVSGGYVYLIDTTCPETFHFLPWRPALAILGCSSHNETGQPDLRLFVGHHAILAWGKDGKAWQSDRLSWEGVTVHAIAGGILTGTGWDLLTDKDLPFRLDLNTGKKL